MSPISETMRRDREAYISALEDRTSEGALWIKAVQTEANIKSGAAWIWTIVGFSNTRLYTQIMDSEKELYNLDPDLDEKGETDSERS